jgi:hypothetical protein
MVPSFELMFMLDLTVVLRALASSLSNPLTMHETQSNNSMAMTGKDVLLRFERTVLQVLAALVAEEALEAVAASVVDLEDVAASAAVVVLEVVLVDVVGSVVVVVVDTVAAAQASTEELVQSLPLPILSRTMLLPELREARQSTFAMSVHTSDFWTSADSYSFHGRPAMKIW